MPVYQVVYLWWLTNTEMIVAHETHTCSGAAVIMPVSIFGCERPHISVSSPGWPSASPEKRGTPASIISTFTQVKNQTFSFHFFSWAQEGGCHCRAWESPTWGGQMVYMLVSAFSQICSHVCMKQLCVMAPKDSCVLWSYGMASCCN